MKYKNFELDPFQIDAIKAIDMNYSVVVSAATGTGKTLIADYVINEAIKNNKEVIYTSPIKALSNQKFREFKSAFGDKVGLLTGDVAINATAPILIMTTEIYRNMLLEKKSPFPNLSYVVFDEIHYINDIERGTVWEESLIFSPNHVRFVCLSATIPNYKDFAGWIENIKGHKVETINYMKRAVPLSHELFDYKLGICSIDALKKDIATEPPQFQVVKGKGRGKDKFQKRKVRQPEPNYMSLVHDLNAEGCTPAIFFTFSRKDAFSKGEDMSRKYDYTTSAEKKEIIEFLRQEIPSNISSMDSVKSMRLMLQKGFGVHHAGILPKMKEIVEKLFGKGLLKVLFATETFAVGINMPAKTVIMNSIKKYDGVSVRFLSTKEYFQMAGRAGRRGIDKFGKVIVLVNRNDLDISELERVTSKDVEPITSRFSISYNTALNLIKNHKKEEREEILSSNFGFFMKRSKNQNRIDQSYINYLRILKKMDYISDVGDGKQNDYTITWKGNFATHIFAHDLVISEAYYSEILKKLTPIELAVFLTSLEYEGRPSDKFNDEGVNITPLLNKLNTCPYISKRIKKTNIKKLYKTIQSWVEGKSFSETIDLNNLAEGDLIRLLRRVLDCLKQIKSAIIESEADDEMLDKIRILMDLIDRDIVSVEF